MLLYLITQFKLSFLIQKIVNAAINIKIYKGPVAQTWINLVVVLTSYQTGPKCIIVLIRNIQLFYNTCEDITIIMCWCEPNKVPWTCYGLSRHLLKCFSSTSKITVREIYYLAQSVITHFNCKFKKHKYSLKYSQKYEQFHILHRVKLQKLFLIYILKSILVFTICITKWTEERKLYTYYELRIKDLLYAIVLGYHLKFNFIVSILLRIMTLICLALSSLKWFKRIHKYT